MDNIRIRRMLDYLKEKKTCTLRELMDRFGVSSATVHRDAAELAKRDAVDRTRGGLVFNDAPDARGSAAAYQERAVANRAGKIAAARKALALVQEGDIVFLDSSTTVFELALMLKERDFAHLTVITNAVPVMNIFRKFPAHWPLIGLGGNYDPQLNAILGETTLHELARFNITKAFVSAFGADARNVTTNHERQASLLRAVLAAADKKYLLMDKTKLNRAGIYRFATRGAFDAIITDKSR